MIQEIYKDRNVINKNTILIILFPLTSVSALLFIVKDDNYFIIVLTTYQSLWQEQED